MKSRADKWPIIKFRVVYLKVLIRIGIKCHFVIQGSHIKIRMNSELPVQVDGEPWIQAPSDIVVLRSALKVSFTNQQCVIHTHSKQKI